MKYKYIIHRFYTPRDNSGNVYCIFSITDTRSGRQLVGKDVPESNLRGLPFDLNGGEWKQNYYYAETAISKREFSDRAKDTPYVGCCPSKIAAAFKKMMKSRKRVKA